MNILIIGAGIVGSIYGWSLTNAGHAVTHLVRPGRAEALSDGISMDILDLRRRHRRDYQGIYRITAIETVETPTEYALVIFPGHHFTMDEVIRTIVPRFPSSDFLFMTQNWKGAADIDAALPASRYVFGDAKAGGSWRGVTLVGAIKAIDIGPSSEPGEPLARRVIQLLESADIEAPYHANMMEYLWVQFATNAGLWPALVEAGSFKALFEKKNRHIVAKGFSAVRECIGLLERRGLRLADYPEVKPYLASSPIALSLTILMMKTMFAHSEWTRRVSAHALSDPREIRAFYFDVLDLAKKMGYPMPVFASYEPVIESFTANGLHSAS
jgi:2-dehydropantoate 2-reductase